MLLSQSLKSIPLLSTLFYLRLAVENLTLITMICLDYMLGHCMVLNQRQFCCVQSHSYTFANMSARSVDSPQFMRNVRTAGGAVSVVKW